MTELFNPPLEGALQDNTAELRPKFDDNGLVAGIAQDVETGEVLMLAWMNDAAIAQTLETGKATFWSRSRQSIWVKGESSGNFLNVTEMRIDCDQDAVLMKVRPVGSACHTGRISCFYRKVDETGGLVMADGDTPGDVA